MCSSESSGVVLLSHSASELEGLKTLTNSRLDVICEVVFAGMEPDLELIGNRLPVEFSDPDNLLRNSIQNLVTE
jgi:hypothetical protein